MKAAVSYSVSILGAGRVATHLGNALFQAGHHIVQVYGRNPEKANALAEKLNAEAIHDISLINPDVAMLIMAVSDDAIGSLSAELPLINGCVAHTAGFRDRHEINSKHKRKAVFYPLQTFTFEREVDFSKVPFFIEADEADDLELLRQLAAGLSPKIIASTIEQRRILHLAAVMTSNFSNALYIVAKELLDEYGLDFSVLHPLLLETAQKALEVDPREGQTGPARRNDQGTIEKHLKLLEDKPQIAEIYQLMTNYIINTYHNKTNE